MEKGDKIELMELDDGFDDGLYFGRNSKTLAKGFFLAGKYSCYPC